MKELLSIIIFLFCLFIVACFVIFLLMAIAHYSAGMLWVKDFDVKSCDELPNLKDIDTLLSSNRKEISILLNELSKCENNVIVCSRSSKCENENYSKRKVSSGNTIIEWKKVHDCKGKGALYIGNTSACEIQVLQNFMRQHPLIDAIPVKSYNY